MASSGRIIRVDGDTLRTQVSGLRNGVAESFLIYAATEDGRSEAADSVTATPTSGMEGEVAGLIVKFAGSANLTDGQSDVPGEDKVSSVDLTADTKIADDVHLIELSESVSPEQATQVAAELQSDPSVEWAEPDVFVFPSSVPGDPEYESSQWNLWDEWGLGLPRTSSSPTSSIDPQAGSGVTVAVIDTGITAHPDLDSQLVPGYDFVSDPANLAAPRVEGGPDVGFDADGQPGRDADPTDPGDWRGVTPTRDSTWHGTQVAGVIAAQAGNSEGIMGVAPGAKIQPIRALSWRGGLMSDIISSITWASGGNVDGAPANAHPADVITMSFAAQAQCSVALQDAIDGATERGSVLVAAAGNANDDVSGYAPANCRDVIAVAATGRDGKRAPYSNYGPGIDIAAPGGSLTGDGGVLSTSNTGTQGPAEANYRSSEGTSIAAAQVAGAIARVKSDQPDINATDLRARFLGGEQVRAFPDQQCDPDPNIDCGTGLLTLAQVSSLPAGVTITGGPDYTITLDCSAITGKPTVFIGHQPGERLFTPGYNICGGFLQVNNYVDELGRGGVALNFSGGSSEILPNSVFESAVIKIVYYRAVRATGNGLDIVPATQTRTGTKGFPAPESFALTGDDFTAKPTFTISPPLPSGLSIDPATGVVSGTAAAAQPTTTYTVTATNGSEVATSQYTLTIYEYTVIFQPGSGGTVSPTSEGVVNSGDSVTLPTPTKPNNAFNGWYTSATGGTLIGQGGDTYVPTSTIVLYAQWTPPYTVTINRQGGSGTPSSLTVAAGNSVNLPTQTNRSALTFAGWFDSASGTTKLGDAGVSFTPTSNTTIYAQWNATLSYSLGGGSLPGSSTQVVNINQTPTITLPTPTRSGYAFTGWYESTSSSAKKLGDGGGSLSVTANDTLYAKWQVLAYVTFLPGDYGQTVTDGRCEADPNSPTACRILWQTNALVLPTPTSPTGLKFDGWWQNSTFTGSTVGGGGDTWSRTPYNATLYSRWTGTITFDANGGTINTASQSQRAGWPRNTEVPYRPGFAFEGWFDSGGTLALPRQSDSFTMKSTDTWTARWVQNPSAPELVSASLSDDRKTIRMEFSGDVQALYGLPSLCSDLTWNSTPRDNSFDVGFARSCTLNGSVIEVVPSGNALALTSTGLTVAYDGRSLAAASDATSYVHQTGAISVSGATPTATVTFDTRVGSVADPNPVTAALGSTIDLPEPTRTGFTLLGWAETANGTPVSDPYTVTGDVTLYAQWERAPAETPVSGGPPQDVGQPAPPRLDVRPPRIELEISARPTPARPASVVIGSEEVELVVERDEDNTELDVTGDDFSLTVATSDTQRTRITPTSRRSLVAPVRGFVEVNAAGYAPQSTVALYLVPTLSPRMAVRNATELYFLGEVNVGEDQTFGEDFQLPDWALAGEYSLQINGYTPEGALKSINLRLDLIDRRADAVSVARACVFPEDSVKLTPECRQSLRSLKQVLPDSVDTLTIDITGVAYAQGNKKKNRAVALERAERVEAFLERNDISGDVTVDVVTRKELAPGLTLGPPPVVVGDSGKPASTVVMTVEWTTEIGPEEALAELEPLQVT